MAFFDQEILNDMKRQLVVSFSKNGDEEPPKHAQRGSCAKKCMVVFVLMNTQRFFQKLKLGQKFLDEDPSTEGSNRLSVS